MSDYRCKECGHVGEYVAPAGVVCTPKLTAAADANMERVRVYNIAIRALNAERRRAKGQSPRAKKKRLEIAAVIDFLANDPAFLEPAHVPAYVQSTQPEGRAPP